MISKVNRLEELLLFWEEAMFRDALEVRLADSQRVRARTMSIMPPEWRHVRKHLLGAVSGSREDIAACMTTQARLMISGERLFERSLVCDLDVVPYMLWKWCRFSRKVFHMTETLQWMLKCSAYEDLFYDDVQFPHEAFALSLEQPIRTEAGHSFDCILFARELDGVLIELLPSGLETRKIRSATETDRLARGVSAGARKGGKHLKSVADRLRQLKEEDASLRVPYHGIVFHNPQRVSLGLSNGEMGELLAGSVSSEFGDAFSEAFHLIIGVSLYLTQKGVLEGGNAHSERVQHSSSGEKPDRVVDEAEVCHIGLKEKIAYSPSSNSISTEEGKSLRPHWRIGHWRRPPGQGKNPEAPRTVWVRPVLVRKEHLEESQLPLGVHVEL